ncbi:MAG: alpha/beta fold hydrolase, partial [Gemmatimonadaceae bacterium]
MFPAGAAHVRVRWLALPGGVSIRVAESGDASGAPVLLLHGWGASLYMWRDWFAPLAAAGRRVIAVDLPGHGLSDKPTDAGRYSLGRMVASLRELIEIERFDAPRIIGQSMGGAIALELALARAIPV